MDYTKLSESELEHQKQYAEMMVHRIGPNYYLVKKWEDLYINCTKELQRRENEN